MKQHLSNNRGDANVSKMTIIAIVFVVGAILLVMLTSAFRGPIGNWFETVVLDWFKDDNGEFTYTIGDFDPFGENPDDPLTRYTKRENGTYAGIQYIHYDESGNYIVLRFAEDNGGVWAGDFYYADGSYNAYGAYQTTDSDWVVSDDGLSITVWGMQTFTAQIPET